MIAGMEIQAITSLVNVDQGDDMRPSGCVGGGNVRDFLTGEEIPGVAVGHRSFMTV